MLIDSVFFRPASRFRMLDTSALQSTKPLLMMPLALDNGMWQTGMHGTASADTAVGGA